MNEKKLNKMVSSLARIALVMDCKNVAQIMQDESVEAAKTAVTHLSHMLLGACGLLAVSRHPDTGPSGDEVLENLKNAMAELMEELGKAAEKAMAEEQAEMLAKCKVAEPQPDTSAPAQEEPVAEPSSIPEFKGMSEAEIAASMERIFNAK